jgi:DNA ligase-1
MRAFANLLDRLAFTPQRNGKLTLLRDFMRDVPDPERGCLVRAIL